MLQGQLDTLESTFEFVEELNRIEARDQVI